MKYAEFTLYVADCTGNQNNTSYPHPVRVTDLDSFRAAVSRDHVSAKYRAGYRSKDKEHTNLIPAHRCIEDFECANAAMYDNDNTHSDHPADWITPAHIQAAFPGVPFYVSYSRNHMKQKGPYSPRPRFHVYFAIDPITDAAAFTALKSKVCAYFPQFDQNAKDAARFFFGVEKPQVEFFGESEDGQ
ncbi:MAG: hypothetical protein LBO63_05535 [Oscillospiraceae bacterium]|jgi:hypothetical protein|nr:hypothetical protein [Oscillospiraceae bacterium]